MSKLPLLLMLCLMCTLEGTFANNYFYYPSSAGAVNYQYPAFSPYVYSAYALPVDCDKSTSEGGGEEGASTEGGSSEGSTEGGESKEGGESTEGSSESSGEEKKEGEGSSEEGGEKKEEGSGEEKKEEGSGEEKKEGKKEDSKKKVARYIFPPVSYAYPPQTAQQIVYSAPSYPSYMPYKAYSVVQQPASYSLKSSGYSGYPYYSLSSVPVSAGAYSSPVAKVVSYPAVSKTISFAPSSGVGGPAGYWNGNVGYYRM